MKMKKFFALMMAMVMCLGLLAGCGQDAGDEATDAPTSEAPASEAPEGSDATGAAFKFGGIGPLTGENATYGVAVMNGAQIAVDEINAAGGINGYQVEFSFQDDVSDSETAMNAYNKLMDDGMQILVGPVTTGPAISVSAQVYTCLLYTSPRSRTWDERRSRCRRPPAGPAPARRSPGDSARGTAPRPGRRPRRR